MDLPVTVGNEADLGAVAEHPRGAGQGSDDLIYLSTEVGVGGGVIIGGQPLAGPAGFGGEVGHIAVNPEGRPCSCGSRGCWETEIGELALLRYAGHGGDGGREAVDAVSRRPSRRADGPPGVRQVGRWLGFGWRAWSTSSTRAWSCSARASPGCTRSRRMRCIESWMRARCSWPATS